MAPQLQSLRLNIKSRSQVATKRDHNPIAKTTSLSPNWNEQAQYKHPKP